MLDHYPLSQLTSVLANYYGNVVYGSGNDTVANLKQLVYNDYSSSDGVTTGMKAFNTSYPLTTATIANSVSLMTAQNGAAVNPALWLVSNVLYDIDGNGYCSGIATMTAPRARVMVTRATATTMAWSGSTPSNRAIDWSMSIARDAWTMSTCAQGRAR